MNITVTIEEEERQILLLAIARLSVQRPGWLDCLERISDKLKGRVMFDQFRELDMRGTLNEAQITP